MTRSKLEGILLEIDGIFYRLFSILIVEENIESASAIKRREKLRSEIREIISKNREFLIEKLAPEIKLIRLHGSLFNVPSRVQNGKNHLRLSVASWVIKSLN